MSSLSLGFMEIMWLFFSVTVGVLMVTASILLLKERHFSVWMLLIGSILAMLSGIASRLVFQLLASSGNHELIGTVMQVIGAFGALGWLLVALGLLLYALTRRSQHRRIEELEDIVGSLQK